MHSLPSGWMTLFATLGWKQQRKIKKIAANRFHRTLRVEPLDERRMLATVTTHVDVIDPNDNVVSLREAIRDTAPGGIVDFAIPQGTTITLDPGLGEIAFDESLTIDGGTLGIRISGGDTTETFHDGIRIFNITDPSGGAALPHVTMIGLTLTGGDPKLDTSLGTLEGGAIRSEATLTLRDMLIYGNDALDGGGLFLAVAAGGIGEQREVLKIEDSSIELNRATLAGGGVHLRFWTASGGKDTVLIDDSSLFRMNQASDGGALYVNGSGQDTHGAILVSSSKFDQNRARFGGAIFQHSSSQVDFEIVESQITGNTTKFEDEDDVGYTGGGIHVDAGNNSSLRIERSVISGNKAGYSGGGMWVRLRESATLTIEDSSIVGNESGEDGGGVFAWSENYDTSLLQMVTILRSTIAGNDATNRGGGIFLNSYVGTATHIEDSRITGNNKRIVNDGTLERSGGGIYASLGERNSSFGVPAPKFTIARSTVDNNDADLLGGGIFVFSVFEASFVATNTTISNNRTLDEIDGRGGGMMVTHYGNPGNSVDAYLRNVTITQNASKKGGGLASENASGVNVHVANSIISENFDPQAQHNNIDGRIVAADFKHNLYGSSILRDHVSGDDPAIIPQPNLNITSNSPLLGPLLFHGGHTPTHALNVGSPAIDAGSNALAATPLTGSPEQQLLWDQRGPGFTRSFDIASVPGAGAGAVDIGAHEVGLAKVVDIIVSGSNSTHDEFSFGRGEYQGQPMTGSGNQLRTVPVGGADTVSIRFSEALSTAGSGVLSSSLALTGLAFGRTPTLAAGGFAYDAATNRADWKFSAPLAADQYLISLSAGVTDAYGNALDGEWTNPFSVTTTNSLVSTFPSGDGVAGGDFNFVMTILVGDGTRDNEVGTADYYGWQANVNDPQYDSGALFTDGDMDGDGDVDQMDYNLGYVNAYVRLRDLVFADFDGDGVVDTDLDEALWSAYYGSTSAVHSMGDADGDADVDMDDVDIWIRQIALELDWVA